MYVPAIYYNQNFQDCFLYFPILNTVHYPLTIERRRQPIYKHLFPTGFQYLKSSNFTCLFQTSLWAFICSAYVLPACRTTPSSLRWWRFQLCFSSKSFNKHIRKPGIFNTLPSHFQYSPITFSVLSHHLQKPDFPGGFHLHSSLARIFTITDYPQIILNEESTILASQQLFQAVTQPL